VVEVLVALAAWAMSERVALVSVGAAGGKRQAPPMAGNTREKNQPEGWFLTGCRSHTPQKVPLAVDS
jgi:hypothetical protein